jgi:hypothetical protein
MTFGMRSTSRRFDRRTACFEPGIYPARTEPQAPPATDTSGPDPAPPDLTLQRALGNGRPRRRLSQGEPRGIAKLAAVRIDRSFLIHTIVLVLDRYSLFVGRPHPPRFQRHHVVANPAVRRRCVKVGATSCGTGVCRVLTRLHRSGTIEPRDGDGFTYSRKRFDIRTGVADSSELNLSGDHMPIPPGT